MQPEILILDEPTTNLDPGQEAVFLELLKGFDGTLICISHDLIFLYELCEKAVVLHKGGIHHQHTLRELVPGGTPCGTTAWIFPFAWPSRPMGQRFMKTMQPAPPTHVNATKSRGLIPFVRP